MASPQQLSTLPWEEDPWLRTLPRVGAEALPQHPERFTAGTDAFRAFLQLLGGPVVLLDALGGIHRQVFSSDPSRGEILAAAHRRKGGLISSWEPYEVPPNVLSAQLVIIPGTVLRVLYQAPAPLQFKRVQGNGLLETVLGPFA